MAAESVGQMLALIWAGEHGMPFPGPVEHQQGDMSDAVGRCKFSAFGAADICNEVLQFGFAEVAQRVSRLALQSDAPGALWIMDLHNCRYSVAYTR